MTTDKEKMTNSEKDAIIALNRKKAALRNKDNKTDEAVSIEVPTGFSGNDTVEPEAKPVAKAVSLEPNELVLTSDGLKSVIQSAIDQKANEWAKQQAELAKKIEKLEEEKDSIAKSFDQKEADLLDRINKEKQQKDSVVKIFSDLGFSTSNEGGFISQAPQADNRNVYITPNRGRLTQTDSIRQMKRLLENDCSPISVANPRTGVRSLQRDFRPFDSFIYQYIDSVRPAIEDMMKQNGFLGGTAAKYGNSDAATTLADIPFIIKEYLSSVIRRTHNSKYILWQFVRRDIASGTPPYQFISLARFKNLDTGTSPSDWELTPGTPIVGTYQPLEGGSVSAIIKELGMGKNSTIQPVAVPEFLTASSLVNLEQVLQEKIGLNYEEYTEQSIFSVMGSTTAIYYNDGGSVTTTLGDLGSGAGGQATIGALASLRSEAASLNIPALSDGCYPVVAVPKQIEQINTDLRASGMEYASSEAQVSELTSFMFKSTASLEQQGMRLSGYIGKISGCHLFEANSFGVGLPGARGVQTETVNAVSSTTRSMFLIGADAMGWATAMPMEIRLDPSTDYGRMNKFIWLSHETGCIGLDVDPDRDSPSSDDEQLRVLELRTTDRLV
jgi:hypothetical protein